MESKKFRFSILGLLQATIVVACFCAGWQWLHSPGVLIKRLREVEELWFEHDVRVWTDRQWKYWKLRK